MKKYYLEVIGAGVYKYEVFATKFKTQTSSSSSSGYYAFYDDGILVACYPIERTIIVKIDEETYI